jgi:uncharacterized delta-60 repeat protein
MRRRECIVLALATAALALAPTVGVAGGSGAFDRSFSRDGKATVDFGPPSAVEDAAISGGKVLAAGWIRGDVGGETTEDEFDLALARFNRDGTLDRRFGERGRVTTHSGNLNADSVAIQDNGRIVVTASLWKDDFVVLRFLRSGEIDRSFGTRGRVRTDLGGDDYAASVVIQPGGRIVVAGRSDDSFAVARYLPAGTLDSSFGGDGTVTSEFLEGQAAGSDVALQPGGRIVVGGYVASPVDPASPDDRDFAVARYLPGGGLDPGFSEDGMQTADFGGNFDVAGAIAAAGERVALAGQHASFGVRNRDFGVAVFGEDGNLDSDFSEDGLHTLSFGERAVDTANAAAFQRDGQLVLVGSTERSGEAPALAVARLDSQGTLDSGFSGDGRKAIAFESGRRAGAFGAAVAIDGRGRLVAAGGSGGPPEQNGFRAPQFAVARLLP